MIRVTKIRNLADDSSLGAAAQCGLHSILSSASVRSRYLWRVFTFAAFYFILFMECFPVVEPPLQIAPCGSVPLPFMSTHVYLQRDILLVYISISVDTIQLTEDHVFPREQMILPINVPQLPSPRVPSFTCLRAPCTCPSSPARVWPKGKTRLPSALRRTTPISSHTI